MKSWFIVLCAFLLIGCAGTGIKAESGNPNITVGNIQTIQRGRTTQSEIRALFGEPMAVTHSGMLGTMWTYSRAVTMLKDQGFFNGGVKQDVEAVGLSITFDDNGIVKDFSYNEVKPMQDVTFSRF